MLEDVIDEYKVRTEKLRELGYTGRRLSYNYEVNGLNGTYYLMIGEDSEIVMNDLSLTCNTKLGIRQLLKSINKELDRTIDNHNSGAIGLTILNLAYDNLIEAIKTLSIDKPVNYYITLNTSGLTIDDINVVLNTSLSLSEVIDRITYIVINNNKSSNITANLIKVNNQLMDIYNDTRSNQDNTFMYNTESSGGSARKLDFTATGSSWYKDQMNKWKTEHLNTMTNWEGISDSIKDKSYDSLRNIIDILEARGVVNKDVFKNNDIMEDKVKKMYYSFTYDGGKGTRLITLCAIDMQYIKDKEVVARNIKVGYSILNPNDKHDEKEAQRHAYNKANHDPLYEDEIHDFYGRHGIIIQKHLEALADVIQKRGSDIIPGLKRVEK